MLKITVLRCHICPEVICQEFLFHQEYFFLSILRVILVSHCYCLTRQLTKQNVGYIMLIAPYCMETQLHDVWLYHFKPAPEAFSPSCIYWNNFGQKRRGCTFTREGKEKVEYLLEKSYWHSKQFHTEVVKICSAFQMPLDFIITNQYGQESGGMADGWCT